MKRITRDDLEALRNSGVFDEQFYLDQHPDVKALGMDALEHYLWIGERMGRIPFPQFDFCEYLNKNPDVAKTGVSPLVHYVRQGKKKETALSKNIVAKPPQIGSAVVLPVPNRRRMDGRRLLTQSRNRDHFWYHNHVLDQFLDRGHEVRPLPADIRRFLVIAHDFKLLTGCTRSLSHYLNAMTALGGNEFTSLELAPGAHASVARDYVDTHDFVIVNSIAPLFTHEGMLDLVLAAGRKAAIYLHETEWVFDKLKREQPELFEKFAQVLPQLNILCVSEMQRDWLTSEYGLKNSAVVHEVTALMAPVPSGSFKEKLDPATPLTIVMAGTLQPRKGVTLFSEVADLAHEAGLPWCFRWAGKQVCKDEEIYKSPHVEWVGNLDNEAMFDFVTSADIFLLSSEDDPFPLCVLEALQAQKRVCVYRKTGVSELFDSVEAPGVMFDSFLPASAFSALKRTVVRYCTQQAFDRINERLSLFAFVSRLNEAVAYFNGQEMKKYQENGANIAAVVHLYYHDLWCEISSYLRNLSHLNCDLYITLCEEHSFEEFSDIRRKIAAVYPQAIILECSNRGMDVGPFVMVMNHIAESKKRYDYLIKVHSKKSLKASGEVAGAKWRRDLYEGLLGTPTKIDHILDLFATRPGIGMVGPRGMLLEKTTRDLSENRNVNQDKMTLLGDRLGVSDGALQFFRGSMFWSRFEPIFNALSKANLTITDFEEGHAVDGSAAHAMERLFACIIRSSGQSLYEFDDTMPKTIRSVRGKHSGEDVYVIGAGASCDYLDTAFFDGKVVIGVNKVYKRFRCNYIMMKEYIGAHNEPDMLGSGAIPVIAKWHSGNIREGLMQINKAFITDPSYLFFDHLENRREIVDLSVIGHDGDRINDKLVVSYSTITTAMHFAAYLGAKNIILVGHDCGLINGKPTFDGYYGEMKSDSPWKNIKEYEAWLNLIESQTILVRDKIKEIYGCNIVSINPFVNFGLEGNKYERGALPN